MQRNPAPPAEGFVAATTLPGNSNQPPIYSPAAIAHGEQGSVLLSIHVLGNGLTDFVSVTQSSGYQVLDQAAVDAAMHWRFQPARMAGKPVVMVIPYWINFNLQTQNVQQSGVPPDH